MTKKRISRSPRKAKKNGIIYLFLIPVLFLAVYLSGQPQTFLQQANTNTDLHAEVAPTFTSIGDCVANNNCPPTEPLPEGQQQSVSTEPTESTVQPTHAQKKEKTKKTEKSEKSDKAQLIEKIKELLKELTNGKCDGQAEALNSNYAGGGDDIQANRHGHRRKKWRHKRGLWKLLKCLKKNGGEPKTPSGGTPVQPTHAPAEQPQDQPTEAPVDQQPTEVPQEQPSEAPAAGQPTTPPANAPVSTASVTGECGTVISKAQPLNDGLQIGSANGRWSNQTKTFNSCGYQSETWAGTDDATKYWCTYLIADSYNLAGLKGLSIAEHAAVVNMRSWWKTASGYKYVENNDDQATMDKIGPGFAILMELEEGVFTGKEHVNLIKTKNVDSRGNGTITTLDSNSTTKTHTYTVTGWKVTGSTYPIRGYGGH